jgi:oligopeptide transport system substrate-binding protein
MIAALPRQQTARRARRGAPRRETLRLAVLATLLVLAGGNAAAADSILRRGVFGEPESLAPRESGIAGEQLILRDLFEGLTTFGPDARVVPGAAESWQASADGRRYTFRLRAGLRWSDGAPLAAQDFVFGWRRALDPRTAASRAQRLYAIRGAREVHAGRAAPATLGVSAPDARTVVIELEYPLPWLPVLLAGEEGFPLPRHAIERYGEQWTRAGNMVSNGAFVVAERRARGSILARRNPHFHAAREVRLDGVMFLPSDDTRGLANRFRSGDLDVNSWPGFPPAQQEALRRELGGQVRVAPLGSVRFLRFNVRRAPFDDVRVRRALSLLVDRDVLVRRVLPRGERASVRPMPDGIPGDLRPAGLELERGTQAQRVAAARADLAAAGFRQRRSEPIRLRLPSGNGDEICIAVAAMWTAGGAPTRLEQSEIKSLIADLRRGDFDVALTGAQDSPAVESYLERFRRGASYNTGGYASAPFERALDAALRLAEPEARARELQRAESILAADHTVVPLIEEVARNLVSRRVAGWVDNAQDIHLSRYLALQ